MKKLMVAVAVMVSMLSAGTAMAVDTQTVGVSASVTGVCRFLTGGTIDFTLDPSVGGLVNGTVSQPTFWCTNGTSYTITDDDGLYELAGSNRMEHSSGTAYIPYTFTYTTTGTGTGRNGTLTMDIASSVAAAAYLDALGGNYNDTVTLTINP